MLIWWLDQKACEAIGSELPEKFPCYIRDQYKDRLGRPGRGRLWLDHIEFTNEPVGVDPWPETSFAKWLGEDFAGIVIRDFHKFFLLDQAGIITDLELNVVSVVQS